MNITSRSRVTMQTSRTLEADLVVRSLLPAFLSNFVNDVPWVHIDIAGTAWMQEGTHEKSYNHRGATGFGVRTLIRLLMEDEKQLPA